MQYVLTEEEYRCMTQVKALLTLDQRKKLQDLCTFAATHVPVQGCRVDGTKKPWGCILNGDLSQSAVFCDHCPAQELCPNEHKRWSGFKQDERSNRIPKLETTDER